LWHLDKDQGSRRLSLRSPAFKTCQRMEVLFVVPLDLSVLYVGGRSLTCGPNCLLDPFGPGKSHHFHSLNKWANEFLQVNLSFYGILCLKHRSCDNILSWVDHIVMVWSHKDFSVIPSIYEYNIIYSNIRKVPFLHPNISP